MIDYFLVVIALVYVSAATLFDIKTREVPDWLSFSLIAIAIFSNFLYSLITSQWNYIIYSLIGLVIFFCFGSLMYYAGQWGGGDAKLLAGLGALLPIYPNFLKEYFNPNLDIPFLLILILNILIAGGFYGLLFSVITSIRHSKPFSKEFLMLIKEYKIRIYSCLLALLFLICISILLDVFWLVFPFVIVSIFLGLTYFFIKAVENSSMYKTLDVKKLTEGDWVVKSVTHKGKIIYRPKLLGITKVDIENLKKYNIKTVLVKEGLPFVPAFLIGLFISLIWGNLFLLIF